MTVFMLSFNIAASSSLGTVRIWHSSTYRLESTLNYGMERVWCVCGLRGSNNVALGYDEGSIIIKVRRRFQIFDKWFSGLIIVSLLFGLNLSFYPINKTTNNFLNVTKSLMCFFFCLLCRLAVRSQLCPWTPMEKSSGPNTVKFSRLIWRLWEMLRSKMERGCLWQLKTWAVVKFTHKPSSITPMEGAVVQILVFDPSDISTFIIIIYLCIYIRFVVVCGDGEYIIYTAMALRNKSFGSAQEFVWAHDSSE